MDLLKSFSKILTGLYHFLSSFKIRSVIIQRIKDGRKYDANQEKKPMFDK